MPWTITEDLDEFTGAAGAYLRAGPAAHNVALTLIETLRHQGPHAFGPDNPRYGWWQPAGGPLTAMFLQTPPYPVLLTGAPDEAVAELAELLAGRGWDAIGVNSDERGARQFSAEWRRLTGQGAQVHQRQRLYRLAGLIPARPAPGQARVAATADRAVLMDWLAAFYIEAGELASHDVGPAVDDRLSYQGWWVWADSGGQVVSMAGKQRPVAGLARIGPVYTPPGQRGRGYGSAVTAAITQAALDGGAAEVLLFTDLANPTSNGIYQRLGYQPVEDRLLVSFTPAV